MGQLWACLFQVGGKTNQKHIYERERERKACLGMHPKLHVCLFFLLLVSPSSSPPPCSLTPFPSLITPWLYLTFLWLISQLVKKRISSEDGDDGASPVLLQHANASVINSETPLLFFTLKKKKKKKQWAVVTSALHVGERRALAWIYGEYFFSLFSFCLISNFSNYNHTLL